VRFRRNSFDLHGSHLQGCRDDVEEEKPRKANGYLKQQRSEASEGDVSIRIRQGQLCRSVLPFRRLQDKPSTNTLYREREVSHIQLRRPGFEQRRARSLLGPTPPGRSGTSLLERPTSHHHLSMKFRILCCNDGPCRLRRNDGCIYRTSEGNSSKVSGHNLQE
jgi:hypothetical protein